MANEETFEPGPSFVEDDRPTDRLTDMPAWLQTFAAQETTRDEADSDVEVDAESEPSDLAGSIASVETDDVVLPDWLRDTQGASAHADSQADEQPSMGEFLASFDDPGQLETSSFISEDDLPDWLRAFSDDSTSAPTATSSYRESHVSGAAESVPRPSTAPVRVPPVENVWLSSNERQALGPGGTLFALLASNSNGALTHATAGASAGGGGDTAGSSGGTRGTLTRSGSASSSADGAEPAPQSNSLRLLLLTLLVVALVIALSFWQFS